ncbi:glycoside hydrolase family 20 protein [Plicaturopsis crispa FD-325 SS-3]|nr:glycoside hydrolase family 20 protein [Plicaturopsis crispa FD-325 SS-3]
MFPRPWFLGVLALAIAGQSSCLWPIPRVMQTGSNPLKLAHNFDISMGNIASPPEDLRAAVAQAKTYLRTDKLGRLVVDRGSSDSAAVKGAKGLVSLILEISGADVAQSISEESTKDLTDRSESYILTVRDEGGPAFLTANSTLGLFRGLATFTQLWYHAAGEIYTLSAPIYIHDMPAYPYRGFMLDIARNFIPVHDIKRTVDAMSWIKMNTLYLHATDSQSWPLEVPGFPELAREGAYSSDNVYSTNDMQDLVAYAAARGVDVVLEIDAPGHSAVISTSHPDYIACNQASPWADFANEPPAGQLRLASPVVTNFTGRVFSSIASAMPSKLFSTGGDELNLNCYTQDVETQRQLNGTGKTLEEALDLFMQALQTVLDGEGKTPVVKQDMVLSHNVTLRNNTVVVVWVSSSNASAVAGKGFRIIHQPSDYFYLDCGAGAWLGGDPSGNSWCDPFKSWSHSYTFDPLANLHESQQHLVLGGMQPLWTEQSGPENLDSIVWPRAASSAEIFWTGALLPDGSPRNVFSALPRLHDLRFRMVQRGVRAIPLQPLWCALRPGACDLSS